jgi:hypothetical protein
MTGIGFPRPVEAGVLPNPVILVKSFDIDDIPVTGGLGKANMTHSPVDGRPYRVAVCVTHFARTVPLLALLGMAACRQSTPPLAVVDSAGVTIVMGPKVDEPTKWHLAQASRVPSEDHDHPLFTIRFHGLIGIDSSERIYSYNEALERVEVYTAQGRLIGTRGRRGGGPGEYQYPGWIHVQPGGSVSVIDYGKRAVVSFASDGTVEPERSLTRSGHPHGGVQFWGDTIIVHRRSLDSVGRPVHTLHMITSTLDTVLASVMPATRGAARFECPGVTMRINGAELIFAPQLSWATSAGILAVAVQDEYNIRVYRGSTLERIIRRPVQKVPARPEDVARLYPEGALFGGKSCRQSADQMATQFGFAEFLPVIGRLSFSPDGTLWVERYRLPGDEPATDLFGTDGRYLGTLAGVGFPVGFAAQGRFLGVIADKETGGEMLMRYRIEPAPW